MEDGQIPVGGNDIDPIRLDLHPISNLDDRHGRGPLEQLDHQPLASRVQVLDNHEGQSTGGRHMPQEQLQCLQPAGRGPDADDGDRARSWRPRGLLGIGAGIGRDRLAAGLGMRREVGVDFFMVG